MDDRQENKLSMYLVVLPLLDQHRALWQEAEDFVQAVADLRTAVANIQELSQTQSQSSKGATANKKKLRLAMGEAAMVLVGCPPNHRQPRRRAVRSASAE